MDQIKYYLLRYYFVIYSSNNIAYLLLDLIVQKYCIVTYLYKKPGKLKLFESQKRHPRFFSITLPTENSICFILRV